MTTDLQKTADRLTYAAAQHSETSRHLNHAGTHVAAADPLAVALAGITAQAVALEQSIAEMQNHIAHRIAFGGES